MIESFSNLFIELLKGVLLFDSLILFFVAGLSFTLVSCVFVYLLRGKY